MEIEIRNFKDLAENYQITIPIIQRDYVQGSDEYYDKRNKFLRILLNAIRDKETRHLDFIYGSCDEINSDRFLPLDGQQRLTTLFLLRWVLFLRSGKKDQILDKRRNYLSYQTRRSTELFCQKLMEEDFSKYTTPISSYITNEMNWFMDVWKYDKTIMAMLDMIDATNELLDTSDYCNFIGEMAENVDTCITFDYLNMDEYHLTDSLYIKMNERGKQLTEFENWKASFIRMLKSHNHDNTKFKCIIDHAEKRAHNNIASYFEYAVEHHWTDLFWKDSLKEWESLDDKSKDESAYPSIDEKFMQFFKYIHEMIYFMNNPEIDGQAIKISNYTNSEVQQEETFRDSKNLKLFFDFFDFWSEVADIDKFFDNLFSQEDNMNIMLWNLEGRSHNLFYECIKLGDSITIEHSQKVLLYALTRFCIRYNIK